MPKLFTTAYFPPVSAFAAMAEEMAGLIKSRRPSLTDVGSSDAESSAQMTLTPSVVYIETCENFQKQSYRNRCRFYAADGVQTLSFPIVHEGGTHKQPISEIKIDYSKPWLHQHKKAIVSAYKTSAYFDYYQDELFSILDSAPEKLIDLNMSLLNFFIEKIGLAVDLRITEDYIPASADGKVICSGVLCDDFREIIHPKRENTILRDYALEKPYFQVFASKYGFKPDLSVMDLLFNEGPDSILYLKNL